MPRPIIALCVLLMTVAHVAEVAAEPIDKARRLVQVSQGKVMMEQMFAAIVPPIMGLVLNNKPNLPEEKKAAVVDATKQEFDAAIPDFIEATAQTYAKHFSENELQDAIDFYESPTGKKFQDVIPTIMQESMALGQELGTKVQRRAIDRLKADGIL